ncbi:YpjP family protein [Bacillus timonensis]|nr:YpjP family protein [Bacillus timonensis]
MNKWFRKALVVSFSLLTFGLVSPPAALTYTETDSDKNAKLDVAEQKQTFESNDNYDQISIDYNDTFEADFINHSIIEAEKLSFKKFGAKIGPVIEDEFRSLILPKIQETIVLLSEQYPSENLKNLTISENPTGGISEKIFHVYDSLTNEDVIRFHVRRDHPPQSGYWFNFHYHTYHDNFQSHHELGNIYWDKNMPPKWMS